MNSKKILGSILLSLAACIWGGMFVVVKIIVEEIHPIQLVFLRYLVAIVFFNFVLNNKKRKMALEYERFSINCLDRYYWQCSFNSCSRNGYLAIQRSDWVSDNLGYTNFYGYFCMVDFERKINSCQNHFSCHGYYWSNDDSGNSFDRKACFRRRSVFSRGSIYLGPDVGFSKKS
ncbi:hypothetical protein BI355_1798 [Companilactobacillus crustorum]|nr:hypothetical protein BI355_1798 [Companilactobacillus crustorum]